MTTPMPRESLLAALPFAIVFASPLVLLLVIAVKRRHGLVRWLSLILLAAAFVSIFPASSEPPVTVSGLFVVDGFALFYLGLFLAAAIAISLLSWNYLESLEETREEFHPLIFLAVLGAGALVSSRHFASFFLGLEVLSVSLYALIAYPREREKSIEAGLKYLILAAASVAFLLFGIALIYFHSGTLEFQALGAATSGDVSSSPLVPAGFALIMVGIGFKLALAPFHVWTPDIYQGAPAPVAALVASISKGAVLGFLFRFSWLTGALGSRPLRLVFSILAVASMFVGNLLALVQDNVKRLLAYSSIAHFGYVLVAFLAAGPDGVEAATFYLVAYFVTIVGAFGIVTILSSREGDAESLEAYAGLFWTRPWTAAAFSAMLLSLAGIPLTAGFLGKFYVAAAGMGAGLAWLVIILVANSALSIYYYIRVIVVMSSRPRPDAPAARKKEHVGLGSAAAGAAIVLLILALIGLGVFPSGLIQIIRSAAASLPGIRV
jgi:NADH-quinone oxidoreductase subunit N